MVTSDPRGRMVMNLQGKFTNGPALISIRFVPESLLSFKMDDLEIDGSSPRASAAKQEPNP